MDYTIVGGAVNLPSRLAPPGGTLISYETYAHVQDGGRCEELGRIQVRGIGHPIAIYRVVDLHDGAASERIRSELPTSSSMSILLMSADERHQEAALLHDALQRLDLASVVPHTPETGSKPVPSPSRSQRVRSG
jgi:adenylate cyclase